MSKAAITFQELIFRLQRHWADRGCVSVQPWDIEKGAGTFNAATYLRALGPEPWSVAYVEPSRRPTDGRYGDNPNRLERHHQFQVLLKPSPKDVQEQYLDSLRAIGLAPEDHDIRFVEDNWESPTLGAWGLGWEVWCDGMEITQFTYFQQCGGYDLDPVSAELTYGLERIAMYLQNVENVYDLRWNDSLTYGDIRHAEERQWSIHNFEQADVAQYLRWFNENMAECLRLCDAGLPLPAYDYCLRCSHQFNILDARGAISVTERQAYILRVREVAKKCADAYYAFRENAGFPLVRAKKNSSASVAPEAPACACACEAGPASDGNERGPLLIEIGTEEIPARLAPRAVADFAKIVGDQLAKWGLDPAGSHADCTPRRMVVAWDSVLLNQPESVEEISGPPRRVAFANGGAGPERTRAGDAFFAKVREGDEVFERDAPGGPKLMARRRVVGRATATLLAEALPGLIGKIHWPKPMRWAYEKTPFVRPVQWLLAALDGRVVPFTFADVASGIESRGHRFHHPEPFAATTWAALEEGLAARKVVLSSAARKARIAEGAAALAAGSGGRVVRDDALLEEVTHRAEGPVPLLGRLPEELRDLPRPVIITPMRVHQRYFPIEDESGQLTANFIVVAGSETNDPDTVARGNARVLRARLEDARFFYDRDRKIPLADRVQQLETRIWLAQHGSMRKKVERVTALVKAMGGDANAQRAAALSKADLATEMVGEFPELQGEMGRLYAALQGEDAEVSTALYEAYLPRGAGDDLPATAAGVYVALADRFDSIVGCFAVGLKPTGNQDPYSLRRQCIGIVNILTHTTRDVRPDYLRWIDAALAGYGIDGDRAGALRDEVAAFFLERQRNLYAGQLPPDVVNGVLAVGAHEPRVAFLKIEAVARLLADGELAPVLKTFKRVANISKGVAADPSVPLPTAEPAEAALSAAFTACAAEVDGHVAARRYAEVVRLMAGLRPAVDQFFADIMVMHDDPAVRASRVGLLARIRDLFAAVADFSAIDAK